MTDLALVAIDPRKRSIVTFTLKGDPWPTIAAWAKGHRFLPREPQTGSTKLFQKGSGLFTAPMRAQFTQRGKEIELQAWVHVPLLTRIMSLFLLPEEMSVRSGGLRAVVPRSIARKAINELLVDVGAEPIA